MLLLHTCQKISESNCKPGDVPVEMVPQDQVNLLSIIVNIFNKSTKNFMIKKYFNRKVSNIVFSKYAKNLETQSNLEECKEIW